MVRRRISFRRVLSSFHRIVASFQFLAITAITLSLNSCYNEPEFVGGNLIPISDLLSVKVDTSFAVSAYTIERDTLISSNFTYSVLGSLKSPIYGKTKADFLTKVLLGSVRGSSPLFGVHPIFDSLRLSFSLYNYSGDKTLPLNVKLYELSDTISVSKDYYAFDPVDNWYYPTQIGAATYHGDSLLTFSLGATIGKKILDADLDSANVASNTNFTQYFKGFYITSDEVVGNGVMYFFDFTTNKTTMTLYYHNQDSIKTNTFKFSIGSSAPPARFNHITHDYDAANPLYKIKYLKTPDIQDSVFYIESLGGVHGLIKLDGIEEWVKKMPIAINNAELRIEPEDYPGMPKDSTVSLLYYSVDKFGKSYTEDQKIAANQSYPVYAKYNKAKKYYSINITTHIQSLLKGRITATSFYIEPSAASAGKVVLRSGSHSKRMKVIITYTKL